MPIIHADLVPDLRIATQLDQALLVSLTDMATIRNVPGAIDYHGSVSGTGSDTGRLRFVSLAGADHFASIGEVTAVTETALTTDSVDIQVTRAALMRSIGDVANETGYASDVDPATLAADMVASYDGYFNETYAITGATAATVVGSTAVDFSHDDYMDAIFTLELNSVPGPFFAAMHPRQFADWQESLRAEGGALMFSPATAEMLSIRGQGFAGSFLGVSIFKMSDIQESGVDKQGFMYGQGALGYKVAIVDGRAQLGAGTAIAVRMDELYVEIRRSPTTASVDVIGNAWLGMAVKEQARIVGMHTDA